MRVLVIFALLAGVVHATEPALRLRTPNRLRRSTSGPEPTGDVAPNGAAVAPAPQDTPAATADVAAASVGADGLIDVQPTANRKPSAAARPGEFVVLFDSAVQEPAALATTLQAAVAKAVAASSPGTASAAAANPYSVVSASSVDPTAAATGGYIFPVRFATIKVDAQAPAGDVVAALMAQPGVTGVYPNTIYTTQQVPCAQPSNLAAYTPAFTLRWAGCLTPSTTLVWYGERCGADFSLIQWTGVYAIDKASGQLVPNCHSHYTDPQYRPGTPFGNAVFGGCGVAPTSASLPTKVCSDPSPCISTAAASSFAYTAAITGCGLKSQQVLYTGAPCGPANKLVRWSSFQLKTAAGKVGCPTRAAGAVNPMFDREWFGACGSQPANFGKLPTKLCDGGGGGGGGGGGNNPTPSPAPTPPPSGARLQREALKSGEKSLPGMARIQAVVNNQVPIINADKSVTVAVLDTGGTFLDELNTQTGMSFVGGRRNSDWSDIEKHGTHVSGTIGARNNGFGVFGVLPNVKILPIKVLGNDGGGSMSDIMAAIDYVATNAVSLGIGVINLSLGGTGSVRDPICQSIQAATTRGVVVVVAAGNDGDDLAGYSPASCPATIAVTAISPTANTPAGFSNWLNPGASAAEQRRVVAAPGVNILSTLPDGSYDSWQGTSMASPHVAGAAARCFAAGECKVGDGAANRERFLNSIWAKYDSDPAYRWTSARTPVASGKWYGPLVWADKW